MSSERSIKVSAAILAALIATAAVQAAAQGTAPNPTPAAANPNTPSPPAPGSTGTDRGMGTGAAAKPGSISSITKADGVFVREAGAANKAEIALGTLAGGRAASPDVKAFGQQMVTDHTKAYAELTQAASGKGVTVPTEPNAAQKRTAAKLEKLSGAAFDKEFSAVMVTDHKKAVDLFRNEATNGRDADVKAYAAKSLPTLEEHLKMAQHLQAQTRAQK